MGGENDQAKGPHPLFTAAALLSVLTAFSLPPGLLLFLAIAAGLR